MKKSILGVLMLLGSYSSYSSNLDSRLSQACRIKCNTTLHELYINGSAAKNSHAAYVPENVTIYYTSISNLEEGDYLSTDDRLSSVDVEGDLCGVYSNALEGTNYIERLVPETLENNTLITNDTKRLKGKYKVTAPNNEIPYFKIYDSKPVFETKVEFMKRMKDILKELKEAHICL